jgi:hypothetical protein
MLTHIWKKKWKTDPCTVYFTFRGHEENLNDKANDEDLEDFISVYTKRA